MRSSVNLIKSPGFRYNFANTMRNWWPYAGAALTAFTLYSQPQEPHKNAIPAFKSYPSPSFDFAFETADRHKTTPVKPVYFVDYISGSIQSLFQRITPFKTVYAVEAKTQHYLGLKAAILQLLATTPDEEKEELILGAIGQALQNADDIEILDVLYDIGYNPLSISGGHAVFTAIQMVGTEGFDFDMVLTKLMSYRTEDLKIADLRFDTQSPLRYALSQNNIDAAILLIKNECASADDIIAYDLYVKHHKISYRQSSLVGELEGQKITEVDHLFDPATQGLCAGLSMEFLRYHIRHKSDWASTATLNKKFEAKLEEDSLSASRLKRIVIYQHSMQGADPKMYWIDKDSKTLLGILDDRHNSTFFINTKEHAIAAIKSSGRFYIFEPNYGIFEAATAQELLDIIRYITGSDKIFIKNMDHQLEILRLVGTKGEKYEKDSKNTYKLFEALCSSNIAEIARLSKIQNISSIDFDIQLKDAKISEHEDSDYSINISERVLGTMNILAFAIESDAVNEESLFTLIANSSSLDISDTLVLSAVLSTLFTYDRSKSSDRVLDALMAHTSSAEAKQYLAITKTAIKDGSLVPGVLKTIDDDLIVNITYNPKVESAAKIVELLEKQISRIEIMQPVFKKTNTPDGKVNFSARVVEKTPGLQLS